MLCTWSIFPFLKDSASNCTMSLRSSPIFSKKNQRLPWMKRLDNSPSPYVIDQITSILITSAVQYSAQRVVSIVYLALIDIADYNEQVHFPYETKRFSLNNLPPLILDQ